jgi:hypothetical protein
VTWRIAKPQITAFIGRQPVFANGSVYFLHGRTRITGLNKHFV